jgi:hypothetical protein
MKHSALIPCCALRSLIRFKYSATSGSASEASARFSSRTGTNLANVLLTGNSDCEAPGTRPMIRNPLGLRTSSLYSGSGRGAWAESMNAFSARAGLTPSANALIRARRNSSSAPKATLNSLLEVSTELSSIECLRKSATLFNSSQFNKLGGVQALAQFEKRDDVFESLRQSMLVRQSLLTV